MIVAWSTELKSYCYLQADGVGENRAFVGGVLEALWALGLRQRAVEVIDIARRRGLFPEAVHNSANLWCLNLHR